MRQSRRERNETALAILALSEVAGGTVNTSGKESGCAVMRLCGWRKPHTTWQWRCVTSRNTSGNPVVPVSDGPRRSLLLLSCREE